MDWASIGGLLIALLGIIIGQSIDGGSLTSLFQPAAFITVVFGTIGAVLLQSKPKNFINGLRKLRTVFVVPIDTRVDLSTRVALWGMIARKEGTLRLEQHMENEPDPFAKKGLRLIIDGISPQVIRDICVNDLYQYESSQRSAIKIWDSAGGYAPTVGILAAVMGLIHVMEKLSDPSLLGSGIAVAFVATIYGVGLANLFFIPVANKLKMITQAEITKCEMLIESFISIANGEHTLVIEERLAAYLD